MNIDDQIEYMKYMVDYYHSFDGFDFPDQFSGGEVEIHEAILTTLKQVKKLKGVSMRMNNIDNYDLKP